MEQNKTSPNDSVGRAGKPALPARPNGSSGRAGRYLKYAIGEIILVVIGILIALSINNWNQERIRGFQENKILNTLLIDLKNAKEESESALEREEQIVNDIVNVLKGKDERVEMANNEKIDSLYRRFMWVIESGIPTINTYSDLRNAGQTNLISNEDIRVKFTALEQGLYGLQDQLNDRLSYQHSQVDRMAINTGNFVRVLVDREPKYNIDFGPKNDYNTILNDQKFLNVLTGKLLLSTGVIRDRKTLLSEINTLIALIENEITKAQQRVL